MAASERCSRCDQEVRWGWRDGREAYWHREPADHAPIFGRIMTAEEIEEVRRQREEVVRYDDEGRPYTSAEWEIMRDKEIERRDRRLALLRGEDPDAPPEPLPAPEVPVHDVTPDDFPPRSGIRQIYNLVERTDGWEIYRFTACRGPYLGTGGKVLSTSDSVVLGARGPLQVDGSMRLAVASWRDGAFDFAHLGLMKAGGVTLRSGNSAEMKDWIKNRDPEPATPLPGV